MKTNLQQASDVLEEIERLCNTDATLNIAAEEIILAGDRIKQRLNETKTNESDTKSTAVPTSNIDT